MIRVSRGAEPASLSQMRTTRLAELRRLGRDPKSDDIDGYRIVCTDLWRVQHYKCCYCEKKTGTAFNDVEHYRPKARAIRRPGSPSEHGYWWLAFHWANLLFACPTCNRAGKNDKFPLRSGSAPLQAEGMPPGGEQPLLIDPGGRVNPVCHIKFVLSRLGVGPDRWWARPRNGSEFGAWTIDVCGLNVGELLELRSDYVTRVVAPIAKELALAIASRRRTEVSKGFARALALLTPAQSFVALSYDALQHFVSNVDLRPFRLRWPVPNSVGR